MKKLVLIMILIAAYAVSGFAAEWNFTAKSSDRLGFVNSFDKTTGVHLMKKDGDHKGYQKLAEHEKLWLYGAIGFTIGFGVAITAGPLIIAPTYWAYWQNDPHLIDWYTYSALSALGYALMAAAGTLFIAAVAFWVLYAIVQHGHKKGYCMNMDVFQNGTSDGVAIGLKFKL